MIIWTNHITKFGICGVYINHSFEMHENYDKLCMIRIMTNRRCRFLHIIFQWKYTPFFTMLLRFSRFLDIECFYGMKNIRIMHSTFRLWCSSAILSIWKQTFTQMIFENIDIVTILNRSKIQCLIRINLILIRNYFCIH